MRRLVQAVVAIVAVGVLAPAAQVADAGAGGRDAAGADAVARAVAHGADGGGGQRSVARAVGASAAMRVVDVPGTSGRAVSIAGAGRLSDGGALVAGTLTPSGRHGARPRILVMRLRHDGLIDTSFGDQGVVTAQLARGDGHAGSHATSIAVDIATGRSWIGAAVGGNQAGAVLALDPSGRRVQRFGTASVVRFEGNDSAPTAIAFGGGRLAVAATQRPCSGCQVVMLDPATGARRGQQALAPVDGATAGRCPQARLDSLALVGANRLVLGGSGGGGASCATRLVIRDAILHPVAIWDLGDGASRTMVAAAGPPLDLCAGIERDGATRLVRLSAGSAGPVAVTLPKRTWTPVTGSLTAVVPLGDGACGALLARPNKPARVLQASAGDTKPAVSDVPRGFHASAISRCMRHVLIIGTRRAGGVSRVAVTITPIVRR